MPARISTGGGFPPEPAGNGPENPGLSARQELAAVALAGGATAAQAARASNSGERTIKTWLASPEFAGRVKELRAAAVDRACGRLADGMSFAASTMRDLLGAESESVRLSAARSVLEMGLKMREIVELEDRIRALEVRRK